MIVKIFFIFIMFLATVNVHGFRDRVKRAKYFELFKTKKLDIIFIQETYLQCSKDIDNVKKQWKGESFWSYSVSPHSRGTAILFSHNLNCQVQSYHFDLNGCMVVIDVCVKGLKLRLISIYAPVNNTERKSFFLSIQPYLVTNRIVILAGDFNCVENIYLDKSGGCQQSGDQSADILAKYKNDYNLIDAFRCLYPSARDFTWFSSSCDVKERLDRIYVSKSITKFLQSVNHDKYLLSDHATVTLALADDAFQNGHTFGEGYWKCNTSVLYKPDFLPSFIELWNNLLLEITNFDTLACWWEYCKTAFKDLIVEKSKKHANIFNKSFSQLHDKLGMYKDFNKLHPGQFKTEMESVQHEIDSLLQQKVYGSIIRSKAKVLDSNEKPTGYFLRKEQARARAKTISKLVTDNGDITDSKDILSECCSFYSTLYSEKQVDTGLIDYFLSDVPRLEESDKELCDGLITYDECVFALSRMANGKSPGLDGLPKEFYVKVFPIIGKHFVHMVNECLSHGVLAPSQRHGLITLICKDPDHPEKLTNWRPISLLNVDYKVISKVLTNRLSKVIGNIVHIDQTCAVPGRSILDNVHLIRNIMDYVNQKDLPCAFISLDQSKAFDRVSHEYLFRALQAYGFGDSFISWVKLLYNDICSSVIVNGFISDPFSVQCSVRQGCGLSPLLYVLSIEPFAIKIRQDTHIKGLDLPGTDSESRLSQYADDTTCIITSITSASRIIFISDLYSQASGALLNKSKSRAMWLGKWKNKADNPFGLQWVQSIKICGVVFNNNNMLETNWSQVLNKMSNTVNLYKSRAISVYGKAVICNVSLCSKLWYLASAINISPYYVQQFVKLIFSFIWDGKMERVSRLTLYLSRDKGGIGVVHIDSKQKAFRVKHIMNLIFGDYAKWHSFAIYWIGHSIGRYKHEYASNLIPHSSERPEFYDCCLRCFQEFISLSNNISFQLHDIPTKLIYGRFLNNVTQSHIPKVIGLHPNVDFHAAWFPNQSDFLGPRQKDITWKILHNVISVGTYLHKIGITKSVACPHCQITESITHAFYECPQVTDLWCHLVTFLRSHGFSLHNSLLSNPGKLSLNVAIFNAFPRDFLLTSEGQVCLLLISLLRQVIWFYRCQRLYENKVLSSDGIFHCFLGYVRERIRIDFHRMARSEFDIYWSKYPTLVTVIHDKIICLF